MATSMNLIVGLGNPGKSYERTRHNVGFMLADILAVKEGAKWRDNKTLNVQLAEANSFLLAKPLTFMNNSGVAALRLAKKHGIDPSQILVIYDDVDLPLGKFRYRPQGTSGGHRGMQSIIESFGTTEIPRIKVGIGRGEMDTKDYVLSKFTKEELESLKEVLAQVIDEIYAIYNKR